MEPGGTFTNQAYTLDDKSEAGAWQLALYFRECSDLANAMMFRRTHWAKVRGRAA